MARPFFLPRGSSGSEDTSLRRICWAFGHRGRTRTPSQSRCLSSKRYPQGAGTAACPTCCGGILQTSSQRSLILPFEKGIINPLIAQRQITPSLPFQSSFPPTKGASDHFFKIPTDFPISPSSTAQAENHFNIPSPSRQRHLKAFWRPTLQTEAIEAYKHFVSLEPRAAAAVEERIALLESSEGP
jgi:hypothetical protein